MGSFATILLAAAEPTAEAAETVNNPILPVSNELFWAAVTFGLLWILMKFVLLPPVVKGMNDREAKVRADLEAAEAAKSDAETELAAYQASLVTTKADAVRRIEDARIEAEAERRQVLAAAEAEAAGVRAAAAQEVGDAKAAAKVEIQSGLTNFVLDAAEQVVEHPVDRAAQARTVEDYVNRAGSSS